MRQSNKFIEFATVCPWNSSSDTVNSQTYNEALEKSPILHNFVSAQTYNEALEKSPILHNFVSAQSVVTMMLKR